MLNLLSSEGNETFLCLSGQFCCVLSSVHRLQRRMPSTLNFLKRMDSGQQRIVYVWMSKLHSPLSSINEVEKKGMWFKDLYLKSGQPVLRLGQHVIGRVVGCEGWVRKKAILVNCQFSP